MMSLFIVDSPFIINLFQEQLTAPRMIFSVVLFFLLLGSFSTQIPLKLRTFSCLLGNNSHLTV
jgi:hypothetical protein